jgi:hypothetical protein
MIDCLILGDSIAVGTHMHAARCSIAGKSGINSWQFNKNYAQNIEPAQTVIISLGSNDHRGVKTYDELQKLRNRVKAAKVFWILPNGNLKASGVDIEVIQHFVKEIAAQHGDSVLPITNISKDGIHPTGRGYKELAAKINK